MKNNCFNGLSNDLVWAPLLTTICEAHNIATLQAKDEEDYGVQMSQFCKLSFTIYDKIMDKETHDKFWAAAIIEIDNLKLTPGAHVLNTEDLFKTITKNWKKYDKYICK